MTKTSGFATISPKVQQVAKLAKEAPTMAFTTLVFCQLFNVFNSRSDYASAFRYLFSNWLLWAAVALSAALQVAVVYVPFLNQAFGTRPIGLQDWVVCIAMASLVLWVDEIKKFALRSTGYADRRRHQRFQPQLPARQ